MAQLQTSTVSGNLNVTGSLTVTGSSTFLSTLSGTSAQFVAITCSNFSPAITISPAGATNQIQFNSGSALSADPNFVWDNVNDRLGVGTSSPNYKLHVDGDVSFGGYEYLSGSNFVLKKAKLYARGQGFAQSFVSVVYLNNQQINGSVTRGLQLTIISGSTLTVVSSTVYDTHASTVASNNLATAISGMTTGQIGVLTSYDAWEGAITTNLLNAAMAVGLTKLATVNSSPMRRPYAAVFQGSSDELTPNEVVEVMILQDTPGTNGAVIYSDLVTDGNGATATISNAYSTNALYSTNPATSSPSLIVNQAGNVGINTNTTQNDFAKFIVRPQANNLIALTQINNSSSIIAWDDAGVSNTLRLAGNPIAFTGDGGSGAEHARINSAGNFGIGTNNPSNKLHVKSSGEIVSFETTSGTGNNYLRFKNAASNLGYFGWGSSGNNHLNISNEATGDITFIAGGSERLRISGSTGNVGIGTTSPSSLLHVNGNTLVAGDLAVNGGDITSTSALLNISSSGDVRINKDIFVIDNSLFVSGSSALVVDRRGAGEGTGGIYFVSASVPLEQFSAGSGTLTLDGVISSTVSRFQMLSVNKDLHLSAQPNLLNNPIPAITQNDKSPWPIGIGTTYASGIDVYIKGTAITIEGNISVPSGGSLQLTGSNIAFSSGNGVDFSANSNAAGMTSELLDDYEEGSFTPTLAGPTSITYDAAGRQGNYVKVGDLVLVTIRIEPASIAGAGALTITGLPFVSSGTSFGTTWIANCRANNLATSLITVIGEIGGGSTTVSLFKRTASSTTDTALLASDLSVSSAIRVTLSYRTA
jgi:hypothetical protein